MADDQSMFSGDDDFISCDSQGNYYTAFGSTMTGVPQGQLGSAPQSPWHHTHQHNDAHQGATHEHSLNEAPSGEMLYDAFNQMEAERASDPPPLISPLEAQRLDIPIFHLEDWTNGGNQDQIGTSTFEDGLIEQFPAHLSLGDDLSISPPYLPSMMVESGEQIPGPWTPLSGRGPEAEVPIPFYDPYTTASSREPSSSMLSQHSSFLARGYPSTSNSSAELYYYNMTESDETQRALVADAGLPADPQYIVDPANSLYAHSSSLMENFAHRPVDSHNEWSSVEGGPTRFVLASSASRNC
jgi:hypothetical protein